MYKKFAAVYLSGTVATENIHSFARRVAPGAKTFPLDHHSS
ncbi:hypothetical protein DAQ1742_02551 [Dickeya aquatica]|uniref:Uncharacterized protein n=1 Tax=Dickeya aquatica TaxID=1401087 RepID=A0A375ACV2_9GAMM|nr:hypothetical protein DAQ1742_02551 [Dickeya aquatica]